MCGMCIRKGDYLYTTRSHTQKTLRNSPPAKPPKKLLALKSEVSYGFSGSHLGM